MILIGDWGLGIGDWGLGPIPNPQSPIPFLSNKLTLYLYNNVALLSLIARLTKFSIFLRLRCISPSPRINSTFSFNVIKRASLSGYLINFLTTKKPSLPLNLFTFENTICAKVSMSLIEMRSKRLSST